MGGGVARMDSYFYKFLNRELVDPLFVVTGEEKPGAALYTSIPYLYTGLDNRFDRLIELFRDADIVQYYGGFAPTVCEAAKAAGVPVIIELMHLKETGQIFDYIDRSICVSETVRKVQPDQGRATVIYNGIDIDDYPFRETQKKDNDKIVILQVSNRGKPTIHLDEIAEELLAIDPRIELWLVGLDQTLPSTDRIKYMGLRDDMPEIYRQADILFLFTRIEAFGLVVAEAMASGCVPIVSDIEGPSEIVTDHEDGFLAPGADKSAVLDTVKEAVSLIGSERWESIRQAGRKKVENRFTIKRCVTEHERMYLEMINLKGRRIKPGPLRAEPTPEADIGEATGLFTDEHWDKAVRFIERMAANEKPIRITLLAWAAAKVAKHAIFRKRNDLAYLIYKKMYVSGFRDAVWMKQWLEVAPDAQRRKFILIELEKLKSRDPEIVMLMADERIESGAIPEALKILEEGAARFPDSVEIKETYKLLQGKIGGQGR
jgi:glycosyltransferase involved in cell wall biosynthesis